MHTYCKDCECGFVLLFFSDQSKHSEKRSSLSRPPKGDRLYPPPFPELQHVLLPPALSKEPDWSRGDVEIECADISQDQQQQQQHHHHHHDVCTQSPSPSQCCYHQHCPLHRIGATEMSRSSFLTSHPFPLPFPVLLSAALSIELNPSHGDDEIDRANM